MIGWVILDTDFLSAFQKIDQLSLVKDFFQVERLIIPPAVYGEISQTRLIASISWPDLDLVAPDGAALASLRQNAAFSLLGPGEQEAIALSYSAPESILLMNDNQARRVANGEGLKVLSIPAFLLAAKEAGFLDRPAMASLIKDLKERDHYRFKDEVLRDLLA